MIRKRGLIFAAVGASVLVISGGAARAADGEIALFANGEDLATDGFVGQKRTRDGWELRFDHIFVTVDALAAHQTEPPFDAGAGGAPAAVVTVEFDTGGPVTLDLAAAGDDGRLLVAEAAAPEGHYNALTWSVVPAPGGDWAGDWAENWAGQSMVFIGTATKDGQTVPFTLTSDDTHAYACGEYVGDERKGFVTAGGAADLEITFHLDHVFGRADKPADDPMNLQARGFDAFAGGGPQAINLAGLHIGHVGEGHCAVSDR
ncbi:MAG: hypothetical protein EA405_00920 [Rhodospirillales bacterium]|nr:MAG: hypothetical protein EA405_00920 [Rhodospirillales bacterium]